MFRNLIQTRIFNSFPGSNSIFPSHLNMNRISERKNWRSQHSAWFARLTKKRLLKNIIIIATLKKKKRKMKRRMLTCSFDDEAVKVEFSQRLQYFPYQNIPFVKKKPLKYDVILVPIVHLRFNSLVKKTREYSILVRIKQFSPVFRTQGIGTIPRST